MLSAALLLAMIAVPHTSPPPWPTATEVVEAVKKRYAPVTDFSARLEQVTTAHGPRKRTVKMSGKVFFKRPAMMRWDYPKRKAVYVSDGTVLWVYDGGQDQATKLSVKGSQLYAALMLLFGQTDPWKDHHVKLASATPNEHRLVLTPRGSRSSYKRIELSVSAATRDIRAARMVAPDDSVTDYRFLEPSYRKLKSQAFRYKPGPKTRVIDKTRP